MIIKVKTLVFCENFMSTETFTLSFGFKSSSQAAKIKVTDQP